MLTPPVSKKFWSGNILLLGFILVMFLMNLYPETLFYRPRGIHQWRQTDCLSIAKNYYEEGMAFFQPSIHFQGVKGGKAVSEFPILNYSVAGLWKLFGEHEFIYRLLEYSIFITAVFFLLNTMLLFCKSVLLSAFPAAILLTSPLLAYYGPSFIADVPAFAIGIMSFCLFFRFYYNQKLRWFYLALILASLAVLIKASALTSLLILLTISFIDLFNLNAVFGIRKLFAGKIKPVLGILLSLVTIFSWYAYALHYNNNNTNDIFLLTVLPIWEMSAEELAISTKTLFGVFFPYFLNVPMLFFCSLVVLFVVVNFKKLDGFLRVAFVLSMVFFFLYLILFFQVFNLHDYYLCNLMIFPLISAWCAVKIISERAFNQWWIRFGRITLILLFVFNGVHCSAMYRLRVVESDGLVSWYPFIKADEKELAKYHFWYYGKSVKNVEELTPVLRKLGIRREDKVLTIPDHSFNISLYLMDQKGYTIAEDHFVNDTTVADRFFSRGIKYVIMNDTSMKRFITYRRISSKLESMGIYNNVEIFRVK
jgi:hypothetical protein